jgi:hypothetical protein
MDVLTGLRLSNTINVLSSGNGFFRLIDNVCGFNFVRPPCLVLKAILFLSAALLSTKHRPHELKPMLPVVVCPESPQGTKIQNVL